jgi:Holliday junction resolvasome RuvABC endonuclease subunit
MRTLGLDPSLRSYGWCVYDSEALEPRARLVASGHEGTLSDVVPVARFMHFRAVVADLLRRYSVDGVGIESPAYGGGPFSETHFGLMMFSLEAVFEARKDTVLFDPSTLKSMAAGKGSASKADMQRAVQLDTMNPGQVQSDEADAYCVARHAARFLMLRSGALTPDDLSPREKRVFLERKRRRKLMGKGVVVRRTAHVFRENSRFFTFSSVPPGDVKLPAKSMIDQGLLSWLEPDCNI